MAEEIKEMDKATVESGDNDTLSELKESVIKETLDEIINKDSGLLSGAKKKLLQRYLKKDGDVLEFFEDILIENLLEKDISKELKQFKEDIYKAQSLEALNAIKDSFLSKIGSQNLSINTPTKATVLATSTVIAANHSKNKSKKNKKEKSEASNSNEHYFIDKFDIDISQKYKDLYDELKGPELPDLEPFACAMKGYDEMKEDLRNPKYLTIVDFTKPNDKNRFYVINMTNNTVEYATTVGHGSGSGKGKYAKSFSNTNGSYQSSLGFYRVPDNIEKKSRWSGIRMTGTEGSNDNASSRGIYMHPGGSISKGCFTLPKDKAMEIMNKIKGDSLLFAYAKSKEYFAQSDHFDTNSNGDVLAV